MGETRPLKSLELFSLFSSPFHHCIRCYYQVLVNLDAKPRNQSLIQFEEKTSQTSLFLF